MINFIVSICIAISSAISSAIKLDNGSFADYNIDIFISSSITYSIVCSINSDRLIFTCSEMPSMSKVYRIIDVQADEVAKLCFIYCRDVDSKFVCFTVDCVFKIVIGASDEISSITDFLSDISNQYSDDITVNCISLCDTYYRGEKPIADISISSSKVRNTILNKIKYNNVNGLFLCNTHRSVEDETLFHYGLYGKLFVRATNDKLEPCSKEEEFDYSPKIASFDFEMESLSPVNKLSEPYMASLHFGDRDYVIYSKTYLQEKREDTDTTKYVLAETTFDVVRILIDLIIEYSPDIVVGYNIYNADIPIIYHTLLRRLYQIPCRKGHPRPYYYQTSKIDVDYVQSEHGTSIKIPGMDFVDVYGYLRKSLQQESLKLGDVGLKYLNSPKDPFSYKDLHRIYLHGTVEEKHKVMDYCAKDSYITLRLYNYFNIWNVNSGTTSITGCSTKTVNSKGEVDMTYGMCSKRAEECNMYIDTPNVTPFRPKGGLVMPAIEGFYTKLLCLDINSLYPNIDIQYNIDSNTIKRCYNVDDVCDPSELILVSGQYFWPRGNMYFLKDSRNNLYTVSQDKQGILPYCLERLLENREKLKKQIEVAKSEGNNSLAGILSGLEKACKNSANGACGAKGEQSKGNPISDCTVNDIITTTGQTILLMSKMIVESMGGTIVGGDTDSLFISYKGDYKDLLVGVHSLLPDRIRFKLEYIADKFFMYKKKNYAVWVYDKHKNDYNLKIAGFKAGKSSSPKIVRELFELTLRSLFMNGAAYAKDLYLYHLNYYIHNWEQRDIEDFCYNESYSGKSYKPNTYKKVMIESMKQRGVELIAGNSISVVPLLTIEKHLKLFNCYPQVTLPKNKDKKSVKIFSVEEMENFKHLVDVEEIFNSKCDKYVYSIIEGTLKAERNRTF